MLGRVVDAYLNLSNEDLPDFCALPGEMQFLLSM